MSRAPSGKRERERAADPTPDGGEQPGARAAMPILVIGMHRSGTSALARTLKLMGVNAGDEGSLLPPHPTDNPAGYWERADVVATHDEFLKSGGYSWNAVGGFDAAALDTQAKAVLGDGLRKIIAELGQAGRSWFVKDPRLCLLLSQWLPLLKRCACVVVVRDPREVAASILREGLRGAFTSHFLLALWEKYLRTALKDLSGRAILFVSYDRLLDDPVKECERLSRGLRSLGVAGLEDPPESALRECLEIRLRRSAASPHAAMSQTQQALHAWLEAQSRAPSTVVVGDVPAGEAPDAVLVEYRKVVDYVARDTRAHAVGDLGARISDSAAIVASMQEQVSALRQQQWDQGAALRQDLGHVTEQVSALRKEQWDHNASLRQDVGHSTEQASAQRKEQWDLNAALRQDLGRTTEQVSAQRKEQWDLNAALRQDLGRTTEQVSALRQEQWELGKKVLDGLDALSAEPALRAQLESELQRSAAITAERDGLLQLLAGLRPLEERAPVLEAELKQLEAERNALTRRVAQLETELETTRLSRERALEAAVKLRRALDAQLGEDKK